MEFDFVFIAIRRNNSILIAIYRSLLEVPTAYSI